MKYTVFYSWQSDLPNKDNRSFIENCVKKAIKKNTLISDMKLFGDYERDTRGLAGSPNIVEAIFDKINKSDVFICDISIINYDYNGRKTPNPNVLTELGYAAKVLGWERIICVFNFKYGSFEDIPFDIRQRRIIGYDSIEKDAKEKVSNMLSDAIKQIHSMGLLYNPLKDYMKGKIDYCLLEILKQLCCMIFGTVTMSDALSKVNELLNLDESGLQTIIEKRISILGFFAKNDLGNARDIIEKAFLAITTANTYRIEWSLYTLEIIDWIRRYQNIISLRARVKLYSGVLSPAAMYNVTSSKSSENSRGLLLVKKYGQNQGQVLYSGTMGKEDVRNLLSPYRINDKAIPLFVTCVMDILKISNKWIDDTGGEFILDPDYYVIN